MATAAASLVQRDARLEQVLHGVQNACAQLGSAQQHEIDQATAMLLSLADSPHIVDDTCYVLAHSHDDAVQFHTLGAILHAMHLLDAENNARQVRSLVDMREWLLHTAVDRMRAWLGGHTWPAYVRTRHLRVIVMLSQRAGCQHARADPSPLLSLGQHIADLLNADEACMAVGATSLGSFSTRFTEIVGMTPSAYRAAEHPGAAEMPDCTVKAVLRPRRASRIGEARTGSAA